MEDITRRRTLAVTAAGLVALAGCASSDGDDDDSDDGELVDDADDTEPDADDDANDSDDNEEDEIDPEEVPPGESLEELDGLVITEHELVEPEEDFDRPEVVGIAENQRDETIGYVQISVRVYNEDDVMLDSYMTNTTDLPANTAWSFEVWVLEDFEDIASYDIRIADSVF